MHKDSTFPKHAHGSGKIILSKLSFVAKLLCNRGTIARFPESRQQRRKFRRKLIMLPYVSYKLRGSGSCKVFW